MTKDKALKLALEALTHIRPSALTSFYTIGDRDKAITAIKEALANDALEKKAENARELGLDYEPEQEPVAWEGGEGWESLAWELCADENGEDSCNKLIWEGGPIPEPWGDRWMKYEEEAKRLIALVQKHTTPPQRKPVAWGVFEGNLHDMFFTEAEAVEMAQLKGAHAEVKPLYTKERT